MTSALDLVVPVPALGAFTFAVLVLGSVFFVNRQQARGFTMVTNAKVLGIAALASLIVTLADMVNQTVAPAYHVLYLLPAASVLYLLGIAMLTDFSIHKIPTESAWLPAFVGVGAFLGTYVVSQGMDITVDRIFALVVLAALPLVAFISVVFSGGGAADYRVAMAGYLATAWWVDAESIFLGLFIFVAFTITGRLFFSKRAESGRRMTPAGPAYVSLFAFSALYTLLFV